MEGKSLSRDFFYNLFHINDDSEYTLFMHHNFVRNSHCTHVDGKVPVLRRPERSKHEYRKIKRKTHKIVCKQMLHLLLLYHIRSIAEIYWTGNEFVDVFYDTFNVAKCSVLFFCRRPKHGMIHVFSYKFYKCCKF